MPKSNSGFTPVTFVRGGEKRVAYSAVAEHRYRGAGWTVEGEKAPKRPTRAAVAKARAAGRSRTAAAAAKSAAEGDETATPDA